MTLQVIPVKFQKEVESNDDLVDLILESFEINDDDILVFSQKIISKMKIVFLVYLQLVRHFLLMV